MASVKEIEALLGMQVGEVLEELAFLKMIDQRQDLYLEHNVRRAVYR